MSPELPRLSAPTSLGIALTTLLASCTLITNGRIEEVTRCEGQPNGTSCGNQYDDGIERACMNEVCVPIGGGTGGGSGGGSGGGCGDAGTCPDPLDTLITSHPSDPSGPDVVFQFDATRVGATFECSLDGAAFASCVSPANYADLSDGEHTFAVRATEGGETDDTPAELTWTVDVASPDTTITSGPGAITGPDVTFEFTGNLAASFECKLEPRDAVYAPCTSPLMITDLPEVAPPGYRFLVRALSADDVPDATPAEQSFIVDATGPMVEVSGNPPEGATNQTRANLSFSTYPAEPNVTFACRFNTAPTFTDCTSGFSASGLVDGLQTLRIEATDRFGNAGPIREYEWTVGPGPATTIYAVRTQPIAEHTRVRVQTTGPTSLRMTHVLDDRFFAQESANGLPFSGITIYPTTWNPADPLNVFGAYINVTGTVRNLDGNTALVDATFSFQGYTGTVNALYAERSASVLNQEQNEGLVVSMSGTFYEGDPGSCEDPSASRIVACDDGGDVCVFCPTAAFPTPDADNNVTGVLEGAGGGYHLQVFEAYESNDACL